MKQTPKALVGLVVCLLAAEDPRVIAADPNTFTSLLYDPEFRFHPNDAKRAGDGTGETARTTPFWNTDAWDDIVVMKPSQVTRFKPTGDVVLIRPGKRVRQFAALPDLGVVSGDIFPLSPHGSTGPIWPAISPGSSII